MKAHRIFVSSVQKELAAERLALRDYLLADPLLRRFVDVFLFEDLPAADRRAGDVYLAEVRLCDIYLGLFANDYGWEDDQGLSPTERVFQEATRERKTRLIYVKGSDDRDKHSKMRSLIAIAGNELIRRRLDSVESLLPAVYASLVDYLEEHRLISVGPWHASPCVKATLDDLHITAMQAFVRQARYARNFPLLESVAPRELLTHLNLLDSDVPTNAAVLLFGTHPQRFIPTSEIKCAHFHGTEIAKPIPLYQTYKGTVFELADQAIDFVMSKINAAVGTRAESAQAPVTYEIPREVVAEGIVNAVAHRDYGSNASVQVMLFSDRLEITNPGRLPESLTLESLRHPHSSVPHNPLIAEPMYLTQYIERMGTGTGDMIRRCTEKGLREPGFSYRDGFVTTIWRLPPDNAHNGDPMSGKMSGKMLSATEAKIVVLMRQKPEITFPELAVTLRRTERTIERLVRKLREQEIIGRVGPAKGGHWEVLE